jgi:hypothetical protein
MVDGYSSRTEMSVRYAISVQIVLIPSGKPVRCYNVIRQLERVLTHSGFSGGEKSQQK